MSRQNQNLTSTEAAIERSIAASHGFIASTGPHTGDGSSFQLRLAIINGDVATVRFDGIEDLRWFVGWIERMPADPLYANVPSQVARQLRSAIARENHDDL
jgi:hypothetical protein